MQRMRGFRIRHKFVKFIKRGLNRGRQRQHQRPRLAARAMSNICRFARSLTESAKRICNPNTGSGYIRLGKEEGKVGKDAVPKGHLAVYVGEKEDVAHRVLVPVIYFNHPLFGDLLREAEKVYGFRYTGGIHVPCRISEFENVQTKINATGGGGAGGGDGFRARKSWRLTL